MEEQKKSEDEDVQSEVNVVQSEDHNLLLPDINAEENVPQDVDDSQNPYQRAEEIDFQEEEESQDPNQEIFPEDANTSERNWDTEPVNVPTPAHVPGSSTGATVESSHRRISHQMENPTRIRYDERQTERRRPWEHTPRQIRILCPHHGYDCPLLQPGQDRSESVTMSQGSSQLSSSSYGSNQGKLPMSASSFFPSYSYGNTYNQQQQQQWSSRMPPPPAVSPQQQQQRRHESKYPATVDQWVEQAIRYGLGVPPSEGFFRSRFYVTYEYNQPPLHPSQTSLVDAIRHLSPAPLPQEPQQLLPGTSTAQPLQANEPPDNPEGTDLLPHEHQQQ